jgi:endonuclease/exonuclease/phosphatase family metal-dependent hydrolase
MLTVATYNVYLGADLALLFEVGTGDELAAMAETVRAQLAATRLPERAEAVARLLGRERPDLVGLQEVSRWTSAPVGADGVLGPEQVLFDFLPSLTRALEQQGVPYDVHAVTPSFTGGLPVPGTGWIGLAGANVILARRGGPVTVTTGSAHAFNRHHVVRTGIDGICFPVMRGWGTVSAVVEGRPFVFVNTHTEAYSSAVRDAQRDELLAAVGDPEVPVVVVGDLNAIPGEVGFPASYTDAWVAAGRDGAAGRVRRAGATCGQSATLDNGPSTLRERIDYVWVRDVLVRAARVVGDQQSDRTTPSNLWPSDHACLVVDVVL